MYRHLMVPVDESALSLANVQTSVALAAQLGARIAFFHATPDLSVTSGGAALRARAPQAYAEAELGQTHAVLAKAAVSAAAAGVPCTTASKTSDRPAEAIVQAAIESQCDLIVMASRGSRGWAGWLHSSQTESVLRRAPMALLVTRVASNVPPSASERALAIIHDEHRSIAVVAHAMRRLMDHADQPEGWLDSRSLELMLTYLRTFPHELHHPKEERHLHRWLRLRAPLAEEMLARVESEHVREYALVAQAEARLKDFVGGDAAARHALGAVIRELADGAWQHIRFEEQTVLPMAREHLLEVDWAQTLAAFETNNDPAFGDLSAQEFHRMFTHIANLLTTTPARL